MRALPVVAAFAVGGWGIAHAAPGLKEEKGAVTVDGLVGGRPIRPGAKEVGPGADAVARVLAASRLSDYLNPGQPIGKDLWDGQAVAGIENGRPHVRVRFAKPREVEGEVNGRKATFTVSEVVLFEPGEKGPVCLWARGGDKYYFSNVIAGHEDLARWLGRFKDR